jgi:SAM-dependent methyltransferase
MADLGRSFDRVADLYDAVRPGYPDELYDAIFEVTGAPAALRVLDLAAGSGQCCRELRDRGASVVALEPGRSLLDRLRRRCPDARVVAAVAEAIPFLDASFDLVTCATAWHWLRTEPTLAEVRRVVRPGGHLALFWALDRWGEDEDADWQKAQSAVIEEWDRTHGTVDAAPPGAVPRAAAGDLRSRGLDVIVETEFSWDRTVSRDAHLSMLRTHSGRLAMKPTDRDALLAQIEQALQPWPELTERLWGPLVIARV